MATGGIPPAEMSEGSLPDLIAGLDLPRVPQQARSRQKRDALLAAASHLFEQRGYEAVTADEIAATAEVSIGTFYSYFRNKRQVFLTLMAACIEWLTGLNIAGIDLSGDSRAAIRAMVERAMTRDELSYGMRRAWVELLPRDPEIAAFDRQINSLVYTQILIAARRAAAAGLTHPDLDLEATCWAVAILLDRAWQIEPSPRTVPPETLTRTHTALADRVYHALIREAPR
jgi:AcrR family transcriptional regulator